MAKSTAKRAQPKAKAKSKVKAKIKLAPSRKPKPRPRLTRITADERKRRQLEDLAIKRRKSSRDLAPSLARAFEHAQDLVMDMGIRCRLTMREPIAKNEDGEIEDRSSTDSVPAKRTSRGQYAWKTPWALIGSFRFEGIGYAQLFRILKRWERVSLERKIDPNRYARLSITYSDRGAEEDHTLAETLAWTYCLARAQQECDPEIERSLANRYAHSQIPELRVWLSTEKQSGHRISLRRDR